MQYQPIVMKVTESHVADVRLKNLSRNPSEYGMSPTDDDISKLQKYKPL
jgi:hypothetical protein